MVGPEAYDSTKHGVWRFTKNAAMEYAPNKIWINTIDPGGIYTPGVQAMQGSGDPLYSRSEPNILTFTAEDGIVFSVMDISIESLSYCCEIGE